MARPSKCRKICYEPTYDCFTPEGIINGETIVLALDEYETIRLIDLERKTHVQAAKQMGISRTTVTEIYEQARYKIADSIVHGKSLIISGGNYKLCTGDPLSCPLNCPRKNQEIKIKLQQKGDNTMRIAVTYNEGNIFHHFGQTAQFKIYDIENNAVTNQEIVDTTGHGHDGLASFLTELKVDVVICGGIGTGAQEALAKANIQLFGGAKGNTDEAVQSYLNGTLVNNPISKCPHVAGQKCGHHE